MPNIIDQIGDMIQNDSCFAYTEAGIDSSVFSEVANYYLSVVSYYQAEGTAGLLARHVLDYHKKGERRLEPVLGFLTYAEKITGRRGIRFRKHRLHFVHQVNVFLLGLLIHHSLPEVANHIKAEMINTTSPKQYKDRSGETIEWQYSGDDPYGEFLYRWRLAALGHDIGTAVAAFGKRSSQIVSNLSAMLEHYQSAISELSDLWGFDGKNLLDDLQGVANDFPIRDFVREQRHQPYKRAVYFDHGIYGALLFLRAMHEEYSRHQGQLVEYRQFMRDGMIWITPIVWDPVLLRESLLRVSEAIALHNIHQHQKLIKKLRLGAFRIRLNERPLAWLLKVADVLQTWWKPKARRLSAHSSVEAPTLALEFEAPRIRLKGVSATEVTKLKETLELAVDPQPLD